jgi:hypothetical protein
MSISGDNKSIKIPAQHYVGFNKRGDDEIPLGFMTPDGDDAAAVKRKSTVDSWAGGGNKNKIPAQSFENKPLSGFKLGRNIRHNYSGWGQGNVKWRIEDPRGFELEITSPNLASILACTTVENGEILEKCTWGRLGADNILLPISSEAYKAASANTERVSKKVSLKDVKGGDRVIMHNGVEGRYLGNMFLIKKETYQTRSFLTATKKSFIIETQGKDNKTVFVAVSSPKISEITAGEAITPADAEKYINDACKNGAQIEGSGYITCVAVSAAAPEFSYALKPFGSLSEAMAAINNYGCIIGQMGETWGLYSRTIYHNKPAHLSLLHIKSLTEHNKLDHILSRSRNSYSLWGRDEHATHEIQPTDQISWFGFHGTFKTANGYEGENYF